MTGVDVADIRFYAGTLNTNNKTLTTPRLFSYDFGNPRLLNLSGSLVMVTGQTWEYQSSGLNGITVDGDSATISFPNGGTFKGGNGNTYFNLQFGKLDGTGPGTIGDENTRFNG